MKNSIIKSIMVSFADSKVGGTVRNRTNSFYLIIIAVILCLSATACRKDSGKPYDIGEPSVSTANVLTPSDQDLYSDADNNSENDETAPSIDDTDIDSQTKAFETDVDLSDYFDGLSGTAVFLDKSGNYLIYNNVLSEQRISPRSTFKIISTLAAFEFGIVTPLQSIIPWDGTKWKIESWNKDLTITEAFQNSCVWYYRKLIDKIGNDNMTDFIVNLDYGNCDTSQWEGSGFNNNSLIDGFWLESSLLISPREQVDVLYNIFEGETESGNNNIIELKKMMYKEDNNDNYKIYGKTGSGRGGWFIGFFESGGDNTYFAVYLCEQKDANGPKAQEITGNIIEGYFFGISR